MTSLKQTEANRRNAARSTGPRTLEGIAAARFNALKSGVNSSAEFIPGEDSLQYDDLRVAYDNRWNPQTPEQRCLVDRLIRCDWLQRRLGKAEAHLWRFRHDRHLPSDAGQALTALGAACVKGGADFERLQRRINQTQRTFDKTLETLQAMSIAAAEAAARGETPRGQTNLSQGAVPAPRGQICLPPAFEENQQDTRENGFVPSDSPETPPSAPGPIPKPCREYSTTIRVPRSFSG
jgi:hypothetical protein